VSDVIDKLPSALWLVRHGESAGNVARDAAHSAGAPRIQIPERDVDVPLSARGVEQAHALGTWFGEQPAAEQPQIILTSPYRRAISTAEILAGYCTAEKSRVDITIDERLREKEFGILDRLTRKGIEQFFPEQAEIRRAVGKFYHRPPGGESWCDVILRLRSALHTMSLHYRDRRVLIVAHQVVVLCFRYLLETLNESDLLAIDAAGDVANCSITLYTRDAESETEGLQLVRYNWTVPLQEEGASITVTPDANEGIR
jgi:broad specificity phosphatase PhoE